jgi:hypothetical protein
MGIRTGKNGNLIDIQNQVCLNIKSGSGYGFRTQESKNTSTYLNFFIVIMILLRSA